MAKSNLLESLRVAPAPVKPGPRGKKPVPVAMPGLETYAALSKVAGEITEGYLKTSPLKQVVLKTIADEGKALGRAPENYHGEDGKATASLQLRAKQNTVELTPEQVEQFDTYGVRHEHFVLQPHTLRLRPE